MKKIRKAILLPDIHFPDHIKACQTAIDPFIKDFQPDYIIYMGDQMALDAVATWNRNKPRKTEMMRLRNEYLEFNKLFLLKHEKLAPNAKRIWIDGNHEARADWFADEHPSVSGLIEPRNALELRKRGYIIRRFGEIYRLGKLYVLHGKYWNKYHANKTVYEFENSCVYGHTHNPQVYAKVVPLDTKRMHIATCLGCLSNTHPEYKAGRATRWINQFGVVYLDDKGHFYLTPVTIVNEKFIINNKMYGG